MVKVVYFILVIFMYTKNLRSMLHSIKQITQLLRRSAVVRVLFERAKLYIGLKGHLFLLHAAGELKWP